MSSILPDTVAALQWTQSYEYNNFQTQPIMNEKNLLDLTRLLATNEVTFQLVRPAGLEQLKGSVIRVTGLHEYRKASWWTRTFIETIAGQRTESELKLERDLVERIDSLSPSEIAHENMNSDDNAMTSEHRMRIKDIKWEYVRSTSSEAFWTSAPFPDKESCTEVVRALNNGGVMFSTIAMVNIGGQWRIDVSKKLKFCSYKFKATTGQLEGARTPKPYKPRGPEPTEFAKKEEAKPSEAERKEEAAKRPEFPPHPGSYTELEWSDKEFLMALGFLDRNGLQAKIDLLVNTLPQQLRDQCEKHTVTSLKKLGDCFVYSIPPKITSKQTVPSSFKGATLIFSRDQLTMLAKKK